MAHILKIILVIIAITYSLRLINSQSDVLVFGGLAAVGVCLYVVFKTFDQILNKLNSKL